MGNMSPLRWVIFGLSLFLSHADIDCLYLEGHLVGDGDSSAQHRCSLENQYVYNLPAEVLDRMELLEAQSGVTRLALSGVEIQGDDMVVVESDDEVRVKQYERHDIFSRRQEQQRLIGVRTILVIRVQSQDNLDVSWTSSELEYNFFDLTATTFANQYRQCSAGELVFLPAVLEGSGVSNGVGDLFVDRTLSNTAMSNGIENAITAAFEAKYGSVTQFDHVLFCMPAGMLEGWQGYTYGQTWQSYYEDPWCGYYTLPMHEVGHNLGLRHSTEAGEEYGDRSCLMGTSYSSQQAPRMCFNGAKFWKLGWYSDYRIQVNPARDGPWRGKLIGFVDYESVPVNDPNNVVLINVGDLYLVHNRLRDYNSQSIGHGNQVSIARAVTLESKSDLLEGLRPSLPILVVDVVLQGSSRPVVFEICERILGDVLSYDMSIHLLVHESACGTTLPPNLLPAPTPSPLPTPMPITPMAPPTPQPVEPTLQPVEPTPQPVELTPQPVEPTPRPAEPTPEPVEPTLPLKTAVPTTMEPTLMPTIPVPTSSGHSPTVCFSGEMLVELENQQVLHMMDLQVGDIVKSGAGKYSRVYAFGHRDVHLQAMYLQIRLQSGSKLEISPDHMVFLSNRTVVPASNVEVGNSILMGSPSNQTTVLSIEKVVRQGAFAPFTESGVIVVNHAQVSTYVTLQPHQSHFVVGGYTTLISHQWLAHLALSPIRVGALPASTIPYMHKASLWLLQQHPVILVTLLVPILSALSVCALAERFRVGGVLFLCVIVFYFGRRRPKA